MESLIKLATEMNWPFAAAAIGVAFSIGVPFLVRGVSQQETQRQRIRSNAEIEHARVRVSVKNGAITHSDEG